jgi:hypothetical protein
VRSSLRGLLLAFTSVAIAAVTLGELAFNVKTRTETAEVQLAEQTDRSWSRTWRASSRRSAT